MIAAVCVVSAANAPLFLRVYADEDEELRFHTLLHCALDVTDERLAAPPRKVRRGRRGRAQQHALRALTRHDARRRAHASRSRAAGGWRVGRLPGLPGSGG